MIKEPDKKITPKAWQKELDTIQTKLDATKEPYAKAVSTLACIEMLDFNKSDLERMLANERSAREKKELGKEQKKKRETFL